MGLHSHPTGGHRAYKKIKGKEYQVYSKCPIQARRDQCYLDALANLAAPKLFSLKEGNMYGLSVKQDKRENRCGAISFKIQVMGKYIGEIPYKGQFDQAWRKAKALWIEARSLSQADVLSYRDEFVRAKQYYIRRVGELEKNQKNYNFSRFN